MKTNHFTLLYLFLFMPCFVGAQITKPGYIKPVQKKTTPAPAGPKKFSGNSKIIIELDAVGTLYVDYKKIWDFKKGDVWESDLPSGMHKIKLTNGQDVWESTTETKSGQQLIIVTKLTPIINDRIYEENEQRRKEEQRRIEEMVKTGGIRGGFTDSRDGKVYKTVSYGYGQTWMVENLNYNVSGSMCYDNNSSNCATYGRLYTWQQAKQACPPGWRLPTKADFEQLENLFEDEKQAYSHLIKGGKSGFHALLGGGYYDYDSSFNSQGKGGYYWSSTENNATKAWELRFYSGYGKVNFYSDSKRDGCSCRCLKDE